MSIGNLKSRVTIQTVTSGQDSIGQPVPSVTTIATVWADIRYLNGVETIKAGAEASIAKASIRIRKRTDVTAAMQVVYGSTTFKINAVLPNEQDRKYMDLSAEVIA